jgi:hypothetical protein
VGTGIAAVADSTLNGGISMAGKKMEGSEEQKRQAAREARREGMSASEAGSSTGGSEQRAESSRGDSHQERMDLKRAGKQDTLHDEGKGSAARPGSRDDDTPDQTRRPGDA